MGLPSELYDREYFLSELCEGYDRFRRQHGLSPLKEGLVEMLSPNPERRILDAGCGRGEVLLACARHGASVAGVDYSAAAVELTRETLRDVADADVRQGDVTELPWQEGSFDRILLGDVIEHLEPDQVKAALSELLRVLRPEGMLLIHTAPNRMFLRVGWPLARTGLRLSGRGEAADGVAKWLLDIAPYHVNEQTPRMLRRALRRAGFSPVRAWIDPDVLRGNEYHLTRGLGDSRLARLRGTNRPDPGRSLVIRQ